MQCQHAITLVMTMQTCCLAGMMFTMFTRQVALQEKVDLETINVNTIHLVDVWMSEKI